MPTDSPSRPPFHLQELHPPQHPDYRDRVPVMLDPGTCPWPAGTAEHDFWLEAHLAAGPHFPPLGPDVGWIEAALAAVWGDATRAAAAAESLTWTIATRPYRWLRRLIR